MYNSSKVNMSEIADWFKNDEIFFLIGAGFSASSTQNSLGTGKQLANYLIDKLDEELKKYKISDIENFVDSVMSRTDKAQAKLDLIDYVNKLIEKESIGLKQICDRCVVRKGERDYKEIIKKYFDDRDNLILPTHENLVPIIEKRETKGDNSAFIVSLNIDQLIENAYQIYHKGYKRLGTFIGGLANNNYAMLTNCPLWKFHGCVSDVESAVFNSFSYYNIRNKQQEAISELRRLFRDKHCILLGVSLEDDHIRDLIFDLHKDHGAPQAVIVAPEKYLKREFIDYMNKYISLAHLEKEICEFLKELNEMI